MQLLISAFDTCFCHNSPHRKKCAFCLGFVVFCCGLVLGDFAHIFRVTSLSLIQLFATEAIIHIYTWAIVWLPQCKGLPQCQWAIELQRIVQLNPNKHNKTLCLFYGIYCTYIVTMARTLPLILHDAFASHIHSIGANCRILIKATARVTWASCQIRKIAGCACTGNTVTHVSWCMPGLLNSGFLWSRWRRKPSRHSRRMNNPQLYVFGKRPIVEAEQIGLDFADDILQCDSMKEIFDLSSGSLRFLRNGPIKDKRALVEVKGWCWTCAKQLSGLMVIRFTGLNYLN